MNSFAIWKDWKQMNVGSALLVSLIAIILVFAILIILILASGGINALVDKGVAKTQILPKEENKILEEDEDAVVAVLTATIDFNKETGKNAEVKSVTRIEE